MMTVYLTIDQAAERAQVSRNTIKKWISEGLPSIKLSPRMVRIRTVDFDAWMESLVKIAVTTKSQRRPKLASVANYPIEKTDSGIR